MKLAKLLTVDAVSDARFADLDVRGIAADSRKVEAKSLFVAVAGTKDDGLEFVKNAVDAGAVAIMAEKVPPVPLPDGVAFVRVGNARRALAIAASRSVQAPARHHRGGHRHQRQDLGRGVHAPDLGGDRRGGGQHRHHRAGRARARDLRLADHARSGRAASLARRARRRRRHASGAGGVLARPRPVPARRRAHRGRRLHQYQPRSSRLSSDARSLSRRQAAAVQRSRAAARRGGDRRRSRACGRRWSRRRSSGGCGC